MFGMAMVHWAHVVACVLVQIARGPVLSTPRATNYVQILREEMVDSLRARANFALGNEAWVTCTCKFRVRKLIIQNPGEHSN